MKDVIYPELSYKINGIFFAVQNRLGRFCKEKQYCDEIEKELQNKGVAYKRELNDGSGNRMDFLIEDKTKPSALIKRP